MSNHQDTAAQGLRHPDWLAEAKRMLSDLHAEKLREEVAKQRKAAFARIKKARNWGMS